MVSAFLAALTMAPQAFAGERVFEHLRAEALAARVGRKSLAARMEFFARRLIGTPYAAGTLEREPAQEFCFVTLDGLDCVTFAETVLGLARIRWSPSVSPSDLVREVTRTRYRRGVVTDYTSRLHYTSDWFADNAARGTWEDVTRVLPGARRLTTPVFFMTRNAASYPALKANANLIPTMREHERRIERLERWYVPSVATARAEIHLQTGDIIGLVDTRPGLDYAHVGMIVRVGGVPHFVHASSVRNEVVLDGPLSEYLPRSRSSAGFSVVRPRG